MRLGKVEGGWIQGWVESMQSLTMDCIVLSEKFSTIVIITLLMLSLAEQHRISHMDMEEFGLRYSILWLGLM